MQCLNMDFIGPYPDKGYVLVIICTFTRWVELYPVLEATAKAACNAFLKHFGRYGAPTVLRSDNGSHFVNKVIQQFLIAVGTQHNLTLAYSSEENAIVERCNKEVNRQIRAFTFDKATTDDYQEILPFVQRILNSSVNERMKVSPAQLLFGNALDLDRGIFLPSDEENLTRIARELLIQTDAEHNASVADILTQFDIGSYVLAAPRTTPATRMHTQWTGPYKGIAVQKGQYKLLDLITNKHKMCHVTQLKQFYYDTDKVNPVDIARRDHLEYVIEDILGFEGNIKCVSTLRFHVKWLRYDESYNLWERWKNLMDTEQLHKYLISVNIRHLIPRKFHLNYLQFNSIHEDFFLIILPILGFPGSFSQ
jgi:transposase InsO family protein